MAKIKLKYDRAEYRPDMLAIRPESDIRKEYERLRKVANRSIRAIGKSKYRTTQQYLETKDAFKPDSEYTKREVAYKLSELARYVSLETATLAGLRRQEKKSIETLHSHGYDFVTSRNYLKFTEFMEEIREAFKEHKYDSERVATVYEEMIATGKKSPEKVKADFERYYNQT